MFTGIIEEVGFVRRVDEQGTNRDLWIEAVLSSELKADQSVSHNGVCLTVVAVDGRTHRVTVVRSSLEKSQLGELQVGDPVNLERCLRIGDRLDGHMVQGHVDTTTECTGIKDEQGSWKFTFRTPQDARYMVLRGSICVNGASLTIAELTAGRFSVSIIPYTFDHTTFRSMKKGDLVNLEFDVIGKYVEQMLSSRITAE